VQEEGARAHGKHGPAGFRLSGDEADQVFAFDLPARALAAGNEKEVQGRALIEGDMGNDDESFRAGDRRKGPGRDHAVSRASRELFPHAEKFPRPDEIEFLHVRKHENAEVHTISFPAPSFVSPPMDPPSRCSRRRDSGDLPPDLLSLPYEKGLFRIFTTSSRAKSIDPGTVPPARGGRGGLTSAGEELSYIKKEKS